MIEGALLAESLKPGTLVELSGIELVRLARYEVSGQADYQPTVWTMVEFRAPDSVSQPLAEALSSTLQQPGWYANWNSGEEAVVVFPGRVFRYARGDEAGRNAAQAYGRACGVPEAQLDWAD